MKQYKDSYYKMAKYLKYKLIQFNMKKTFILIFTIACLSFDGYAQNANNQSDIVIHAYENDARIVTDNGEDVHIYTDNSSTQKKTSTRQKKSTYNNVTVYTNDNYGRSTTSKKNVESLAVYKLFGEQYKRTKGCQLTIINSNNQYRQLKVNGRPDIVKEVIRLFESDKDKGYNVVETYSENKENIIINTNGGATIGLNVYSDDRCDIFLSWQE